MSARGDVEDARFFVALAGVSLAIVVVGFGPSFFVRDAARPPLGDGLALHGALMTAWYALVVVQSALVARAAGSGPRRVHRVLGSVGGLLVVAIVWSGVDVSAALFVRGEDGDVLPAAPLLFGNLANLAAFTACVVGGLVARRRRDAHARLLGLAGVVVLGPAAFRMLELLGVSGFLALGVQAALVAATARHDRAVLGRVHGATWSAAAWIVFVALGSFTLGASDAWHALAETLFAGG